MSLRIKKTKFLSLFLCGFAFALGKFASANEVVEIPIETVLLPSAGFDDNDQIQFVVHGNLPDTCHLLSNYKLERTGPHQIRVRQYALRLSSGYCNPTQPIPPHFMLHIPFTTEVPLGQLAAANYQVVYQNDKGSVQSRNFQVTVARTPSIDDYPYASVSSASGTPLVKIGSKSTVELHGILNSSCVYLNGVKVVKQKDVFIVLPTVRINTHEMCLEVVRPWSTKLDLGKLELGHYLVHVRGMNGSSVNHIFQVVQQ